MRTQEYAFHIFRPTVADRLCALRGGAFHSAVRMGRHHARVRTARQADAGNVAFRHVAARLLAVGTIFCRHSERSREWSGWGGRDMDGRAGG